MPYRFLPVSILCVILFMPAGVPAAETTLEPVADVEFRSIEPNATYGSATTLSTGGLGSNTGNATRRALLRFDTSGIPPEAEVESVELGVTVTMTPPTPPASTFELRRMLAAWSETESSWNNRLTGVPWEMAGALGAADASGLASSTVEISSVGSYVIPSTEQIVADVQGWVEDPESNHGWMLRSQAENVLRTARHFGAREHNNSPPRLTVNYTVPVTPPTPPTLTTVGVSDGRFSFSFEAGAGYTYRVEFRDDLTAGAWELLRTVGPLGSDETVIEDEALETGIAGRYFRVVAEP
jgi:hypothetical protein